MRTSVLLFLSLVLSCAATARADDNAPDTPQAPPPPLVRSPARPDFMLRQPRGWISLSGAVVFPSADSDIFGFLSDNLTLDNADFRSKAIGFEVGVALTPLIDVVGGIEGGRSSTTSEYRDYVTAARDPIPQTTKLAHSNITAGVRYSPLGRGRRLSEFAFVRRRVTPFVGGGLNIGYYSLTQNGQFVDFKDFSVFQHYFESTGWGTGAYLQGGTDLQVWRALYLKLEAKYTWTDSPLNEDFVGFDDIDLSGLRSSFGITVVF